MYRCEQPIHSARLTLGIVLLSCIVLFPAGTSCQGHPSARIEALGGSAVTGIMPDQLTDLYLNPAYGAFAERTVLNFGRRSWPISTTTFPVLNTGTGFNSRSLRPPHIASIGSGLCEELSVHGISLSDWKLAVTAEWRFEIDEETEPRDYYYIYSTSISDRSTESWRKGDEHFWRFDLSAARELGGSAAGFRIGGWENTDLLITASRALEYSYQEIGTGGEIIPYRDQYEHSEDNHNVRVSTIFLQAGITGKDDRGGFRGIDLTVSRSSIDYRDSHNYLSTTTRYEEWGDESDYSYGKSQWQDERSGYLWTYDVRTRMMLGSGLRLYAGCRFAHMTYETSLTDMYYRYYWEPSEEDEDRGLLEFSDTGRYGNVSAFVKLGRTAGIRDDLRVTLGFHGSIDRKWTDEDPVASVSLYTREDDSELSFLFERPLEFSTDRFEAAFAVPLALEFEPAAFFTLFSGFTYSFSYRKADDTMTDYSVMSLELYEDLIDADIAAGEWNTDPSSTSTHSTFRAAVGCSLHYRDRLFFDLYTGSDLTPESVAGYVLDARYTF